MTRDEFLRRLERALRSLPAAERQAIRADYERYFADGAAAGREEPEVAESLGNPTRLAAELRLAHEFDSWKHPGGARSHGRALRSLLALAFTQGLLCLPALLAVVLLLVILGAGFVSALYGLFTLVIGPFDQPLGGAAAALLRGVGLLAAGAALLLLANAGIYGLSSLLVRARGRHARRSTATGVTP